MEICRHNRLGIKEVEQESEGDVAVSLEEEAQVEVAKPSMYYVVLVNDDFTPMDFVIEVLEKFFSMPKDKATQVMYQVHTEGEATCGVYTKDVAETKTRQVNRYSRESQHPLLCKIKKVN